MNDRLLDQYCLDWVHWCYTRRYYIAPGGKSILGAMQASKTRQPPNARNSADMQFFNAAVHMLADMPDYKDGAVCFTLYYVEQADYVKREAERLGISRVTYYNRVKAFARKAYSMSASLEAAYIAIEQDRINVLAQKCKGNALQNRQ